MIGNAIKSFVDKHGIHPLPGSIPDMKAMSADYIDLQNIYKAKARADVAEVTESVRDLEAKLDRKHQVSAKEIEAFCKGAAFVKLIHGSPLLVPSSVIDMSLSAKQVKLFAQQLSDEESLLPIHLAIMANDMVHSHPSTRPDQYTAELIEHIWTEEPTFDKASALERTRVILEEIERAGFGGELHNISALTGGMVAQEAIKVLTKQYIPVDNTCVFDGIKSKTQVFKI
jgi:amyloid beta precursor protein binding protein 1